MGCIWGLSTVSAPSGAQQCPRAWKRVARHSEWLMQTLLRGALSEASSQGSGACPSAPGSLEVAVPPGWEERGKWWLWIYLPTEMSGRGISPLQAASHLPELDQSTKLSATLPHPQTSTTDTSCPAQSQLHPWAPHRVQGLAGLGPH